MTFIKVAPWVVFPVLTANDGLPMLVKTSARMVSSEWCAKCGTERIIRSTSVWSFATSLLSGSRFVGSFRGPSIEGAFDCVVSDPPYGVRAGARCAGKDGAVKPVPDELRREHVPATKPYATADVLCDLLEIAARCLKRGGRLAYLLPATNDLTPEDVPRHPALTLVACEPQQLSTKYARWLVVMVKGRDWSARDWTPAVRAGVRRGADAPFAALKEKLALPAPPPAPKR